jgi:phosphohistidine swiveling domain-containing protein
MGYRKKLIIDIKSKEDVESLGYNSVNYLGGKGGSIVNLVKAGFNVPDGIILTVEGFDNYLSLNGLKNIGLFEDYKNKTIRTRVQDCLANAYVPKPINKGIVDALERKGLYGKSLVVRSSATIEDSNTASFAGLFKSFINIKSIDDIIKCIREIYNSMFSDKVVEYLNNLKLQKQKVRMAIVIQEMIAGDVSGVAFTKDPINNNLFLVEVAVGLNDALVSGKITPSRFEVNPLTNEIVHKEHKIQRRAQVLSDKGTKFIVNKKKIGNLFTVNQLKELVKIGLQIESIYKRPQDIEWTIRRKSLYILQSRAITTKQKLVILSANFGGKILRGYPASGGIAKGKTLTIKSPEDKVKAGSILVLKYTDTDYLPLMRKAKGLITEEGGILSHAAIVSRELDLPCVVGIKNAMRLIGDSANVVLDGTSGIVYLVDKKVSHKQTNKQISRLNKANDALDPSSLYCIDAAKHAVLASKSFYYEIFDNIITYYTSDKITKSEVELYAKNSHLDFNKIVRGNMIKSYIIEGLPIYFKDKGLKILYSESIKSVQEFSPKILAYTMDKIKQYASGEISKAKNLKDPTTYADYLKKFLHYRRANLAYLLVNTILCEGYCIRTLYNILEPIIGKYGISFSGLLKSIGSEATSLPLDMNSLKNTELNLINKAAQYYIIAKRWKEESYPVYTGIGATGDKFEEEQDELAKTLNRIGNNKKDYRALFAEALKHFT